MKKTDEYDDELGISDGGEEQIEESNLAKLDSYFEQFPGDYSIAIIRQEPREYKGWLDEFTVDDLDSPLCIRDLITKWGGRVLKILVRDGAGRFVRRFLLPLRSYPPLVNGLPCDRQNPMESVVKDGSKDYLEMLRTVQSTIKDLSPKPAANETGAMMLQLMVPVVTALAQNLSRPPTGQPTMTEMMTLMMQMKDFVGGDNSSGGGGGDDFLPSVLRISESLISKQQTPPQPANIPHALTAPKIATIPPDPPSTTLPTEPIENPDPKSAAPAPDWIQVDRIPEALSNLPPEMARQLLLEILDKMPEDKREALIDGLLSDFGVEFDDPDPQTVPITNGSPPSPGGNGAGPNAGDGPHSRPGNTTLR